MSNEATTLASESPEIQQQPLVSEENFQLLRESQRRISLATGISPSVRVLLNRVITKEQLAMIESQLTELFSELSNI